MTARMQQFNMRLRALFVARRPPPAGRGISLNPHAIAGREIEQQHRAASEKPRKAGQGRAKCRAINAAHEVDDRGVRRGCGCSPSLLAANDGTVSATSGDWNFSSVISICTPTKNWHNFDCTRPRPSSKFGGNGALSREPAEST